MFVLCTRVCIKYTNYFILIMCKWTQTERTKLKPVGVDSLKHGIIWDNVADAHCQYLNSSFSQNLFPLWVRIPGFDLSLCDVICCRVWGRWDDFFFSQSGLKGRNCLFWLRNQRNMLIISRSWCCNGILKSKLIKYLPSIYCLKFLCTLLLDCFCQKLHLQTITDSNKLYMWHSGTIQIFERTKLRTLKSH